MLVKLLQLLERNKQRPFDQLRIAHPQMKLYNLYYYMGMFSKRLLRALQLAHFDIVEVKFL